jgi:tRNA dimethylallyltransferase
MSSSAGSAGADNSGGALAALPPLPALPVICGPTASGKSAIAMWLAQRRPITVISADSRQVYRGFDAGTAKPSMDDRSRVPHVGIDVAEPSARYSAADWVALATTAAREALAAGRIPLIVGGTGFYISALFNPLWQQPPLDADRRSALQKALETLETEELRRWTTELDPARAHLGRTQLLRALEVALLTGARLSDMHVAQARPPAWRASYLLVDPGTELQSRIASRAAAMLDGAWPDEVRALEQSVADDAPAWNATGYAAVREFVRGGATRDATLERVVIETRQYAKRQRTWFRHQLEPRASAPGTGGNGASPARVVRMVPGAAGWQETVDRWITDVEVTMRSTTGHA